jgi:DNA primase
MSSNPFIEIKERLNVVDIISEYIPVIPSGSNFKAKCPFHNDKTPSLIISPEKNIWHCFGCGAGGDVFKFVMEYENISKKEALQKLAKKAGVELQKIDKKELTLEAKQEQKKLISKYELGLKYLLWTADLYHQILLKILQDRQHPVSIYCLNRGLKINLIQDFKLGYAPSGSFLLNIAKKHNLNLDLLFEIGVLKEKKSGQTESVDLEQKIYADKFSDRLTIPVFDQFNKVVGFTARVLPGDKLERPKYLNSPENQWFKKSQLWYGYSLNQKNIRQQKKAIIVEGNMDVIACSKKGINLALASQGTSFTNTQLQKLKPLTKTVWLAFDNDNAGQIASEKFFIQATQLGIEVEKIIIPEIYKDLDEYLDSFDDKQDFEITQLQIKPFLDYWLTKHQKELTSQDLKTQKEAILNFLQLLQNLDEIETEHYLNKISNLTQKSIATLKPSLSKIKASKNTFQRNIEEAKESFKNENQLENTILTEFQSLLAFYLRENLEKRERYGLENMKDLDKLKILFNFLKILNQKLKDYQDLEDYFQKNQEILELISDQEKLERKEVYNYWKKFVNNIISLNLNQILIVQPDLKKDYLTLKWFVDV